MKITPVLCAIACVSTAWNAQAISLFDNSPILWSGAQNISGESDVSLSGQLVQAVSITDGEDSGPVLNGVTFDPFVPSGDPTSSGHFSLSGEANGFSGYGSANAPFTDLSAPYQVLLANGDFGSGNNTMTLTISGLTSGDTYLFQAWVNDSRNAYDPQTLDVADESSGNTVTLNADTDETDGGIGQFTTGIFTAGNDSVAIDFTGNPGSGTLENAFQLRDISAVPEPSTWGSLAIAAGSLVLFRRRRGGKAAV